MNAMNMAKTAYTANQAPIRTPRGTEYEAFARVTRRMKSAADLGAAGFARLAEALHVNRQLWTFLAADVAERENALPEDLRARIFYLAEFTAQHSRKVLRHEEDVAVLLEVNMAVMRGLRMQEQAA